jgi:O-antigen/teichoic acid export membrane protein
MPRAFLRASAIVVAGTATGQLFVFIATPLLARVYSPAEYGQFSYFVSICGILLPIAALRYEFAIASAEDHELPAVFLVSLASSIIVILLLCVALASMRTFDCAPPFQYFCSYWPIVLLAPPLMAAYQASVLLALRLGDFRAASGLRALQGLIFASTAWPTALGLIAAHLASYGVGLLYALRLLRRTMRVRLSEIKNVVRIHRDFPTINAPMALLDGISMNYPLLVIGSIYGSEVLAHASLVQKFLAAPLLLITAAVGQVFIKEAGDTHRARESIRRLILAVVGGLFTCWLVWTALITGFGSWIVNEGIGGSWSLDPQFILLATAPLAFRMAVSPITTTFLLTKHLRLAAIWQTAHFLVTIIVLTYAGTVVSAKAFLGIYAGIELVMYSLCLVLAAKVGSAPGSLKR